MAENPFRWVEIYVQDMDRAKRFYEAVFEIQLQKLENEFEMYAFPMLPNQMGAGGALVKIPGVKPGGNSVIPYFGCKDCAVEASRFAKAGGKIEKDKFSIGQYGHIALGFDTEGNMIGMHSADGACSEGCGAE